MSGTTAGPPGRGRRPLYALFAANAVSMVGDRMTALAIPWFVLSSGGGGAEVGLVGAFTVLPVVLAAFFGGVVVDRLGFARTSVVADLLSALAVALIPLLHATTGLGLWPLIGLVFLGALLDAPGGTARQSLLPDVTAWAGTRPERANAAYQTIQRASSLTGPILAGGLIGLAGAANVLWIDAATFLVSAALVARFIPRVAAGAGVAAARDAAATVGGGLGRYLGEIRAGVGFIRRDPLLARLVGLVAVLNLLEAPVWGVIVPVYARETFGDAGSLGLLFGALGAGSVVGAVAYGAVGHRLPRWPVFATGYLFIGLPQFGLAFGPPLWLAMAILAVIGAAAGPINPIFMTVRQERVPPEVRGRVFGAITALCSVAIPVGLLGGGVLLETVGMRASLLGIAALYVSISLGMRLSGELRTMDGAG